MSVTCGEKSLGKYVIRGELGRGAMGVVYRGFDPALEREVAIKTMAVTLSDAGDDETMRFHREARSAGKLRHPNIVTIYEMGEDAGIPFIAMELLEGSDLVSILKSNELPSVARRLQIVARICDGLEFAHRNGIVHRDVKPANVFIQKNGTIKILDFGIAKLAASDATRTGTIVGTVDYMSPEQVRAERDLDGRSDVFSAGVILYELLFRRRPFQGESLASTMYRIVHHAPRGADAFERVLPGELTSILRGALTKDRDLRFASAGEMSEACARVANSLDGESVSAIVKRIDDALARGILDSSLPEPPADASGIDSTRTVTKERESPDTGGRTDRHPQRLATVLRRLIWPAAAALAGLGILVAARALRSDAQSQPVDPPGAMASLTGGAAAPGEQDKRWDERSMPGSPERPPEAGGTAGAQPPDRNLASPQPSVSANATPAPAGPTRESGSMPDPLPAPPPARRPDAPSKGRKPSPESALPPDRASSRGGPGKAAAASIVPGVLAVGVLPWARLEEIENLETGEVSRPAETTPVRLSLSPGRYRLTLVHPDAAGPLRIEVSVFEGRPTVVSETMPGFETAAMLGALFTANRAP